MTLHRNTIIVASELEQRNKQPREHFVNRGTLHMMLNLGGISHQPNPAVKLYLYNHDYFSEKNERKHI